MILSIPYQAIEIGNIHVAPFQIDRFGKTIARLCYKDNSIDFQDVSILSPPLRILDYNPDTSRLRLDLSEHPQFHIKMHTLHEYLVNTFYTHQQSFLNLMNRSYDAIRHLFYFLLDGMTLSLFIYPTVFMNTNTGQACRISELKAGDSIRCVIRLQGVSQLFHRDELRLRFHHSVPSVWKLSSALQAVHALQAAQPLTVSNSIQRDTRPEASMCLTQSVQRDITAKDNDAIPKPADKQAIPITMNTK
jgi:hypothetical protein